MGEEEKKGEKKRKEEGGGGREEKEEGGKFEMELVRDLQGESSCKSLRSVISATADSNNAVSALLSLISAVRVADKIACLTTL